MRLVESIVSKETLSTTRIIPYINDVLSTTQYNATNALDPEQPNAACTSYESTNPYYSIIFPYDYFYAEKIEITFKSGHRFPKNITIQGTNNLVDFHDIFWKSKVFCEENSFKNCKSTSKYTYDIPIKLYRGFKIKLIGKDNQQTTQLCIGAFEIEGLFIKPPIICKKSFLCCISLKMLVFSFLL